MFRTFSLLAVLFLLAATPTNGQQTEVKYYDLVIDEMDMPYLFDTSVTMELTVKIERRSGKGTGISFSQTMTVSKPGVSWETRKKISIPDKMYDLLRQEELFITVTLESEKYANYGDSSYKNKTRWQAITDFTPVTEGTISVGYMEKKLGLDYPSFRLYWNPKIKYHLQNSKL